MLKEPSAPMMTEDEYVRFHRNRFKMMTDLLARCPEECGGNVLDIGGAGDILGLGRHLRDKYASEVCAVALGPDVETGRYRGIPSFACDIDKEPLPFDDGVFDMVTFASVMEHLYNPRYALDEIARVLRPDGLLLLEMPNAVSLGRRIDVFRGRNPFRFFNTYNTVSPKPHMTLCSVFYTVEEAQALLSASFLCENTAFGVHRPRINILKEAARRALIVLSPRLSDCFAILARRR